MPPVDEAVRSEERSGMIPPPVRAGIGLVASGVDTAKSIPGRLGRTLGEHVGDIATLPLRGLALVARTRETVERTYEELSNRGETIVARWRGRPEPRQTANDAVEEATERLEEVAETTLEEVTNPFGLSEQVTEAIEEATPGAVLAHDQLPLEDYDHLTLGSLRARLPRLDAVALVQLLDYERAHAHRLPVLTMIENRIAKIGAQ
ncbi:MAG TPA: hypothetical protein VGX28_04270 [Frankiaceae bacterium]|jgi:hypothetical protein|nr:hypothetical protein [Frankiaceae bacterium]